MEHGSTSTIYDFQCGTFHDQLWDTFIHQGDPETQNVKSVLLPAVTIFVFTQPVADLRGRSPPTAQEFS